MHIVVLHDPAGTCAEGEVLTANAAEVAKARGVIALPVVPELMRVNASAAYVRRHYGKGWTYEPLKAGRGCPLALHVDPEFPTLHWVARLMPAPGRAAGTLRLATDTAQINVNAAGLSPSTAPVQLDQLGAPDAEGGWTISGRAVISIPGQMFAGLQLYGMTQGVRVVWFAASQTA